MTGTAAPRAAAAADATTPAISDSELTALALAADPDTPVPPDAVSLWDLEDAGEDSDGGGNLLPSWYMPAPAPGRMSSRRQRWVIAVLVASFALINVHGLCSTYGIVGFG